MHPSHVYVDVVYFHYFYCPNLGLISSLGGCKTGQLTRITATTIYVILPFTDIIYIGHRAHTLSLSLLNHTHHSLYAFSNITSSQFLFV